MDDVQEIVSLTGHVYKIRELFLADSSCRTRLKVCLWGSVAEFSDIQRDFSLAVLKGMVKVHDNVKYLSVGAETGIWVSHFKYINKYDQRNCFFLF